MDCSCIRYTHVPKTTPLLLDYLYHFERVAHFYNGSPFNLESYKTLAEQLRAAPQDRNELADVLTRQNETLGCGDATFASISKLRQAGTVAVVTGQQVGLFSGPAFTLYKALTAIRLAHWLSDEGLSAVPVFWLATEDHDLEEVAHTTILDDEYETVPLSDPGVRPAPQSSVGYVKLSEQIVASLKSLEVALPPSNARERLMQDLRECYRPGVTWGHAFGSFLARLFSRSGVVLLDALDESIHRLAGRVYQHAAEHASDLRSKLDQRSRELVRVGYHAQVHVGEDSTLLFLQQDGNRVALRQRDGNFLAGNAGTLSPADLERRLSDSPLDFSANALLRPIVQDTLFPTIAYVTGPSELAYHGQTQVLYAEFGRPQPILFPRAAFTLLDPRARKLLEKYRVRVEDVWRGEEQLRVKIAAAGLAEGWAERFNRAEGDFTALLERLRADIEKIDPTLLDPLRHTQEKMKYQLERLRDKVARATLLRSDVLARHEQLLLRFITPHGELQEREIGGVYFLGRAGYELLDEVLGQIQTRSSDHQVLHYLVEPAEKK